MRRRLLAAILACGVAAGILPAQAALAQGGGTRVYLGDAGLAAQAPAVLAQFTAAHPEMGVTQLAAPRSVGGNQVAVPPSDCGLYTPLDFARAAAHGAFQASAVIATARLGLAINTQFIHAPPASWAALWSGPYVGRVALREHDPLLLALTALILTGKQDNVGPALDLWSQNAGNINVQADSDDGLRRAMLARHGAWMAPVADTVAQGWITQGKTTPFAFGFPKEGPVLLPVSFAIAKATRGPQLVACEALMASFQAQAKPAPAGITLDFPALARHAADWRAQWDVQVGTHLP